MKKIKDTTIIGVDHGYGYTKTAHTITRSGIQEFPFKPPLSDEDILEVNKQIFVVGQIRNEHMADKTKNKDYYWLTLAAIGKELQANDMSEVTNLILSTGLPYSFFANQKDSFKDYLKQQKDVKFIFEGKKYHISIKDVHVYPQGLPVLASHLEEYRDKTISVADIGSRTIDVITYRRGKPLYDSCFSIDRKGTLDCSDMIEKNFLAKFNKKIDEEDIQAIMQKEPTSIGKNEEAFVKEIIKFYSKECLKILDSKLQDNILICGGGATVMKNYGGKLRQGIQIMDDIYCNAKGFETLSCNRL